jgi:hypothetical protein
LRQGDDYRENEAIKSANRLVNKHNQVKRPTPVTYFPDEVAARAEEKEKLKQAQAQVQTQTQEVISEPQTEKVGGYIEPYIVCGETYDLVRKMICKTCRRLVTCFLCKKAQKS